MRLLYPKMRKRSGRLGGKGAPGSARTAILNYLAALEPEELGPLLELFLEPLSVAFRDPGGGAPTQDPFEAARWAQGLRLHPEVRRTPLKLPGSCAMGRNQGVHSGPRGGGHIMERATGFYFRAIWREFGAANAPNGHLAAPLQASQCACARDVEKS